MLWSQILANPKTELVIINTPDTFHFEMAKQALKAGLLPVGDNWGEETPEEWGAIFYEKDGEDYEELVETVPGNYGIFYENVFDAIRNGAELFVKPEETVEVLKILEACKESSLNKRTIIL